jgi:hypothetical protein
MGRARGNGSSADALVGARRSAVGLPEDLFANVIPDRRGAVRVHDDDVAHEALRERARKLKGYTISVLDDAGGRLEIKPLCKTTAFMGARSSFRSYEAEGELHYAPERDIWAATLYSGSWDSKYRWLVASGPRLQAVLDELDAVVEKTVAGYDEGDTPLHPLYEDGTLRITEDALIAHLERIESYR